MTLLHSLYRVKLFVANFFATQSSQQKMHLLVIFAHPSRSITPPKTNFRDNVWFLLKSGNVDTLVFAILQICTK